MNQIAGDAIKRIYDLLGEGHSLRWIARELGVATATVASYRQVFVADEGEPVCGCGSPSRHRGRCSWRRANEGGLPGGWPRLKPAPPSPARTPSLPESGDFTDLNLIEQASVLNRWLANYTGPENDPVAVEVVLAFEHIKRAIELRDERLKPLLAEALTAGAAQTLN